MLQIAVYGKGGIGKSTITANLSVALSDRGLRVMQVGCDPKHDSTRLLLGGRPQTTVLDYVHGVPADRRRLEDVVIEGTHGILCTEAGGPEPGIGCAGRGILTTFDALGRMGADSLDVDVRLYDVLGDVVCGGFAVPLRSEYADAVIVVTSGEFMALYAANNIIRGMGNFRTGSPRMLGIVLNSRNVDGEAETVSRFAEAVGTEIVSVVPRDGSFAEAEAAGCTVMELHPGSEAAVAIGRIADRIVDVMHGRATLSDPEPLDDDQMSDLAAGRPIRPGSGTRGGRNACDGCRIGRSISESKVLGSCSAYGAVAAYLRLDDVAVVVHGPMSCAHLMDTTRAKAVLCLYENGVHRGGPGLNIFSTGMDDSAAVFGGTEALGRTLEEVASKGYRRMAVVTTCMPSIIGDDCIGTIDAFCMRHPGISVQLVPADGDITGAYNEGFIMAARTMTHMMDKGLPRNEGLVNLVGTSFFDLHSRLHEKELDDMLSTLGLEVNCRFLDETTSASVEGFCRAGTDILVSDTPNSRRLMDVITETTGRVPHRLPLPTGLRCYCEWMAVMGRETGRATEAEEAVSEARDEYERFVESDRHRLDGVRVMVAYKLDGDADWLLDMLGDLGAEIVLAGSFGRRGSARHPEMASGYGIGSVVPDMERLEPDLLISDIPFPVSGRTRFARLSRMGVGYRQTLRFARYLGDTLRLPVSEGWRCTP